MIDLRSDTVTKPTPAMLKAMFEAEVGDDVFGEDATVNLLQEKVAKLLGKEASIFVPSGTMANQLCIKTHSRPGDEVIVEKSSHIFNNETAAAAALAGVQLHPLVGTRGILYPEQIEKAIRDSDYHHPLSRLICLENTHNRGGGSIYPLEIVKEIWKVAKKYNLLVHMDGARLLNATVALGIIPVEYTQYVDSVTLCLSKGLGAPVGSMVAGDKKFIQQVRRFRKMYGGGMRQVGFLAAAGIYALDHHVERLAEDHQKAKKLAEALSKISGIEIESEKVETNILYFKIKKEEWTAQKVVEELKKREILVLPVDEKTMRAVTHLDVTRDDIEKAILAIQKLFA
ncbi:low-specificity L-threonine aldolase [Candidatus Aerophobetes bacterium]|nr:low-specificity L-threonine aldolase [Candidatus Aerophobetes bacterium]